jgi:ribosomal-protein-alanine N-acetyltransferase
MELVVSRITRPTRTTNEELRTAMPIQLRPATEHDVPFLIELAQRSWHSGFAENLPVVLYEEWRARRFEYDWYPKYWPSMTVAEEESVMLGLVQPMNDEVNGLWVDDTAQGRGVGTLLLRYAEQAIRTAGYERAWLSCSGFNPKAQRFYVARGYNQVRSDFKERSGGVQEEMLIYERFLQPEEPS